MRKFRYVISVLHEYCWLRVRVAYSLTFSRFCRFHDFCWRKKPARYFAVLAYHPVVAELAAEIAACRGNRHNLRAGVKMRERLLAYGVNARGHGFRVNKRVKCSALVFSNHAKACGAVAYGAAARAQITLHFIVLLLLVKHGFM